MNTKELIVSSVAVSLLVAGCATTTWRPPTVQVAEKTGQTYPLPTTCDPAVFPAPVGNPYTISLGPSFQIRDPVVTLSANAMGVSPTGPKHKHKTTLDIVTQLSSTVGASAAVQIILTDKNLHFEDTGLALLGSTPNAPSVFCGAKFDNNTDPRVLTFTVYPAGSNTSASYNLFLMVDGKSGGQLPVIIDPWVDNNGIDGVLSRR